jgi:hypothetical protein
MVMENNLSKVLEKAFQILKKERELNRRAFVDLIIQEFGYIKAYSEGYLLTSKDQDHLSQKVLKEFKRICNNANKWHNGRKGDNGYWTYEPK